jgi:heme-degrading monooxygenase HmoA
VSVAVFASPEAQATWRDDVAHRVAQQRGRERFYVEYDVAVCEVQRRHHWRAAGS